MKELTFKKKLVPGVCRVARCRKKPRNLTTHPTSTQLCGHHAKAQWRIKNPMHAAYDDLRSSALKRKKSFSITLEEFIAVVAPTRYLDDKGRERHCLHIDRKNSNLGYIRGNIRVCTCEENVIKQHQDRKQAFVDSKIAAYA